ncbi:MaoC family dehydratase [uncultured Hydrogenophaga sp.]|uniref:MaoC family dehydratase n=1 Tax=uncultured Hydrogenophaga sp. TaxID=199683 RepID=UPI00258DF854|nr:MaoC family dehydratase [uncultured Hydrogenophaga sp.]
MMNNADMTGRGNYFEDFRVGQVMRHARGKTVTEMDNVMTTLLVMNTAQGHFNEHAMKSNRFGQRITFGGVNIATVVGLAMQDTGENAVRELGMTGIRLKTPVFHGDTLYAYSEVLDTIDRGDPVGAEVVFHHWGVNERDEVVMEGTRRVLVRRRPAGR